jgi:hypothetical protein
MAGQQMSATSAGIFSSPAESQGNVYFVAARDMLSPASMTRRACSVTKTLRQSPLGPRARVWTIRSDPARNAGRVGRGARREICLRCMVGFALTTPSASGWAWRGELPLGVEFDACFSGHHSASLVFIASERLRFRGS